MDFQTLARWNGIPPPYRIYPGQVLRLHPLVQAAATHEPAGSPANVAKNERPVAKAAPKPAARDTGNAPQPQSPPDLAPPPPPQPATGGNSRMSWLWPTRGSVVQRFRAGDKTRQGIRIAGRLGQPVIAAESGVVVYSGSGLPGYGKLIIIKHDKNYLSAYGFNRKLLVRDGEKVARGARVAELGQSIDGKPLLHFEIRRSDTVLDPLRLLPRR